MDELLIHFEKLLATIKNPKNNKLHHNSIRKMILNYERIFSEKFHIHNKFLVVFLHNKLNEIINKELS